MSTTLARAESSWSLAPIWQGATIQGESLFFIQHAPTERPKADLLFRAEKIDAVTQPSTGAVLEEGKDYILSDDRAELLLPEGSRIPFKTLESMYPAAGASMSIPAKRDSDKHLFFGEGHAFHDLQVEVTYTHNPSVWRDLGWAIPESARENLTKTVGKLTSKSAVKIALLGDSISTGANASGATDAKPHMPGYGQLVAEELARKHGSDVQFKNYSVGGTATAWGIEAVQGILEFQPDLLIIAFGMNDASGRVAREVYAQNIHAIMDKARGCNPDMEFILVATMTGNREWTAASSEHYQVYREELMKMKGSGVAVADVTTVWEHLLEKKAFADMTGNGVNHPNDFGHRIYAQVILALFQ